MGIGGDHRRRHLRPDRNRRRAIRGTGDHAVLRVRRHRLRLRRGSATRSWRRCCRSAARATPTRMRHWAKSSPGSSAGISSSSSPMGRRNCRRRLVRLRRQSAQGCRHRHPARAHDASRHGRSSCRAAERRRGLFNLPAVVVVVALTIVLINGHEGIERGSTTSMVAVKLVVVGRLHRARRGLRKRRQLASLFAGQRRAIRALWLERRAARRLRRLLRLHRLRRRLDLGPGGTRPAKGHAAWHPSLARDLDTALYRRSRRF